MRYAPRPGDYFVVRTGGLAARVIRWVTRSAYNHAGVVTDLGGGTVEAKPGGAAQGNLSDYVGCRLLAGCPVPPTGAQRVAVTRAAAGLVGTGYGWADIISLGLLQWGIRWGWVRSRVARSDRLVCSQLVDVAFTAAGLRLFTDGRQPMDVTPGDLARLLGSR